MRKKYFLILLLGLPLYGISQPKTHNNPDSLLKLLNKTNETTIKVDILNQIASKYWEAETEKRKDSINLFATQAIQLSRKLVYSKGLAEALYNQGRYYIASTHRYSLATPCFLECLSLFETLKDKAGISKCYLQLGLISYILQYYEDAIKNFKLSLAYADMSTSKYLMAISFSELDNYSEARKYFSLAIKDYEKSNNQFRLDECYMYLGKLFFKTGNTDSAFFYLNKSIDRLKAKNDTIYLGRPYAFLSAVYLKINDLKKAVYYAEISYKMAINSSDEISLSEATNTLSKAYALQGNFRKAFHYLDLLNTTKDINFKGSTKQKVADMQSMFDFKKKINDQKIIQQKELEKKRIHQRNQRIIFMISVLGLILLAFGLWARLRFIRKTTALIQKEKERSEKLLLNILPYEVAEELKAKGSADAKLIDEVTVLFTDFKGFTLMSEQLTPRELVKDIHECFSAFDQIMEKFGLEKIKTIGDSYMAAGGLPNPNTTHATDAINAALEILHFIEAGKANKIKIGAPYFEIRIGIHTGPVVAGIVGVKKFAYDIWGDTVNLASRMESSGVVGKVNISGSTYELVKDKFNCTYRGKVEAKNKGEVDMYFVNNIQ
ncbi:MAG: adenylate/guanylate cyclase domain-containing protein [Bacteroidetes bacterium]|nr:adenylate/guanylate cyclase domain-containing protein [Bacteroidota bacterium]